MAQCLALLVQLSIVYFPLCLTLEVIAQGSPVDADKGKTKPTRGAHSEHENPEGRSVKICSQDIGALFEGLPLSLGQKNFGSKKGTSQPGNQRGIHIPCIIHYQVLQSL